MAQSNQPIVVTETGPNDVILGRGAPIIFYEGNVRFRQLVDERKERYASSNRNQTKTEVANEIINIIAERDGKFLRKVEDLHEMQTLGIDSNTDAWVVPDNETIIQKIKQALRENRTNKKRNKFDQSSKQLEASNERHSVADEVGIADDRSSVAQENPNTESVHQRTVSSLPVDEVSWNAAFQNRSLEEQLQNQQLMALLQRQHLRNDSSVQSLISVSPNPLNNLPSRLVLEHRQQRFVQPSIVPNVQDMMHLHYAAQRVELGNRIRMEQNLRNRIHNSLQQNSPSYQALMNMPRQYIPGVTDSSISASLLRSLHDATTLTMPPRAEAEVRALARMVLESNLSATNIRSNSIRSMFSEIGKESEVDDEPQRKRRRDDGQN